MSAYTWWVLERIGQQVGLGVSVRYVAAPGPDASLQECWSAEVGDAVASGGSPDEALDRALARLGLEYVSGRVVVGGEGPTTLTLEGDDRGQEVPEVYPESEGCMEGDTRMVRERPKSPADRSLRERDADYRRVLRETGDPRAATLAYCRGNVHLMANARAVGNLPEGE